MYNPSTHNSHDLICSWTYRVQRSMKTGGATGTDSPSHWITVPEHEGIYKTLKVYNKNVPPPLRPGCLCNILEYSSAVWCVSRELLFSINPKKLLWYNISVRISKYTFFTRKKIKIVVDNSHKSSHQKTQCACPKIVLKQYNSRLRGIKYLQFLIGLL